MGEGQDTTPRAEADRSEAQAAIHRFLWPQRIAVIGASRDPDSVGGLLFRNVVEGGFTGTAYPVNPKADEVQGVTAHADIDACPEVPDLVVVAVPAEAALEVVDQAGRRGVPAACVISAGFAEAGDGGEEREQRLLEMIHHHGMRLIGPNCMGLVNGDPEIRLNATFSHTFPRAGRVGMLSQSGALGLAVLDQAEELGLGVSSFVSVGNQPDVGGNDLLGYWEDDEGTDVILLYLESFEDPRRFSRIARRVTRRKPVVVVKSGRTPVGEAAASSHTAAVAGRDVAVDALFAQTGIIRTDTLAEMFQATTLLAQQPHLQGKRVGVVTNGGGPGILAADACAAEGLDVPALSDGVKQRLAALLPAEAAVRNPVDLLAGADARTYGEAVRIVGGSGDVDVVLVIFIPPIVTRPQDVAEELAAARGDLDRDVAIVTVFMGEAGRAGARPAALAAAELPCFQFPEEGVRAVGHAARWWQWRQRPQGEVVRPDGIDGARARDIVESALTEAAADEDRLWLRARDATALLEAYGVPLARSRVVARPEEAADAQRQIGAPVAVKVDAPIHKSDVGGVRLGRASPEEATQAITEIREALHAEGLEEHAGSYLVQEMLPDGIEMAVGVNTDPAFGPLLMVGLGGELIELIGDVSVRVTPITEIDADDMITSLKAHDLLTGHRGDPPADVAALKDLLHRINALVDDVPELVELDLNPVIVMEAGIAAADVRMRLGHTAA